MLLLSNAAHASLYLCLSFAPFLLVCIICLLCLITKLTCSGTFYSTLYPLQPAATESHIQPGTFFHSACMQSHWQAQKTLHLPPMMINGFADCCSWPSPHLHVPILDFTFSRLWIAERGRYILTSQGFGWNHKSLLFDENCLDFSFFRW